MRQLRVSRNIIWEEIKASREKEITHCNSEKAEEFEINDIVYRKRNQFERIHKMDFKWEGS